MIMPTIERLIHFNKDHYFPDTDVSAEAIVANLKVCFQNTLNYLFIHLPGVNSPSWPDHVKKRFRTMKLTGVDVHPEENYAYLAINGTTFSGLSFRTTFGNTLRAVAYTYFYLHKSCNPEFSTPWLSPNLVVVASGDDVVLWTTPALAKVAREAILSCTTRDRTEQTRCLGQCVKSAHIRRWYEVDFCSLWSFSTTGELDSWILCPDYNKLFTQK